MVPEWRLRSHTRFAADLGHSARVVRLINAVVVILTFLTLASCTNEGASSGSFPIVDGTREMGEEAVVLVKVVGGVASCTGTFVSESVVLTAKHCVQLQGADEPYPVGLVSIGVGHDNRDTVDYRARRIDTTPGVYGSGLSGLVGEDVGVITIRPDRDGNFPDVTPIAYRRESPADLVGETVTFIGFGRTDTGGSGLKFTRTGEITAVGGGVISSVGNICSGDSGGPMILEGSPREIVGVASFGRSREMNACPADEDGHNSLDGHLGMIDRAILEAGGCPVEGLAEECNSIDDDCDGNVDETCLGLGESCTADDECAFAQLPESFSVGLYGLLDNPVVCGDTPSGQVCTRPCDPVRPLTSCATAENSFGGPTPVQLPTPGLCVSTGGCEGTCLALGAGDLAFEEPCTDDAQCATGACIDPGDGEPRCLQPCEGDAGQCATGEVCAAGAGSCGACVDESLVSGARGLGEPCGNGSDCASGICVDRVCSRACVNDVDCSGTFHCAGSVCRPGPAGDQGDLCSGDDACLAGRDCVGDPSICAIPCTESCPEDGFTCTDGHCLPDLAVVGEPCAMDAECFDGLCVDGVCSRECGVSGGCPAGLECARDDAGRATCRAPSGGGCSAGHGSPTGGLLALLGLGLLVTFRRRRDS